MLTLTYVIAVGDFTHSLLAAPKRFCCCSLDKLRSRMHWSLITPALLGNVIGGTGLFALLAYAQVRQEL